MKTIFYQNKEIELTYSKDINYLIPGKLYGCGLSLPALGLASYIYTLPKQWRLNVSHLAKQLAMSKNTCRKYLKEIFTNQKAREVFKVREIEINTYDFEEGFYAYDHTTDTDEEELENYTSSVAKDTSKPNRKKIMLVQTQEQRYLLTLCFDKGVESKKSKGGLDSSPEASKRLKFARERSGEGKCSNFEHYKKESKDSFKDSYNTRKNKKDFTNFLDLAEFDEIEQESIKSWINYKQESSPKALKPSQVDFQLKKIKRLKLSGQDIVQVIEKSLNNSWQGLFSINKNSLASKARQEQTTSTQAEQGLNFSDLYRPRVPKNLGGKAFLKVVENA